MFEENIIETEVSSNIVETESDSLIGTPGIDGVTFTPSVSQEGIISWTNNGGLSNPDPIDIKGDKGDKGDKGEKGDTYNLTEQDKKDISDMTVESSENTFNQYYNGKLEDFNTNAESKTTTFDNNYTSKLQSFNENSNSKTNEYNNNAISKVNEFNTNATSKLQEYNTNADNKIAEYDLHSQELDNKIIATRNELERVKNDVLETGTDTDTYIHLEDSAMAEYQELSVDGVCEQETTTGKNLFDESIMPTNTMNGIKWEYTNKKIKISGTATDTYSHNENIPITLQAGTYYFVESGATNLTFAARFYNIDGELIANSQRYNPFTISENATRIELLVKGITSGTSYNQEMNFMVSTTNGNYEPFTGGQPSPSPDYPQEIKTIENSLKITSCNKNLLVNRLIVESITQNGVTIIPNKDDTFTLNGTADKSMYFDLMIEKKLGAFNLTNIESSVKSLTVNGYTLSASISNGMIHLEHNPINGIWSIAIPSGTIYDNAVLKAQLEKGTQATSYEQHLETQIQANLPDGEFIGKINDTYKDTLKVEYNEEDGQYHLVLNKYIGKGILDNTTKFNKNTMINTGFMIPYKQNSPFYNKIKMGTGLGVSNYFINQDNTTTWTGKGKFGFSVSGTFWLMHTDDGINTTESLANWLSNHLTEIYYVLATPYKVDLGIVDMPITYNEITNLFTDSDLLPNINAKYYRNFISTVRNLQVNEKALKQELIDINNRLSALESAQASVVSESEVVE